MSFHHEHMTWQSQDGTWNIGLYTRLSGNDSQDDYDAEWDDDYDLDEFEQVVHNQPTSKAAYDELAGNPGGGTWYAYDEQCAETMQVIAQHEAMKNAWIARQQEQRSDYYAKFYGLS